MSTEPPAHPLLAAVWLPRFHLQAALRARPARKGGAPVALLDGALDAAGAAPDAEIKGLILHASEAAERLGICPGMTPSQALARCPRVELLHRLVHEEELAQNDLLACALRHTPHHEATAPGLCMMDFTRVRAVHDRAHETGAVIHKELHARQLDARVGLAANADLAFLAAQAASPVLLIESLDHAGPFLAKLPVSALRPPADLASLLHLWGVRTLAQLTALPRAEVAARLGLEGARLWDIASGGRERLLRRVSPGVRYREEMDLEHPVEALEPLLFLMRRMLDGLCLRLAGAWLAAAAIVVDLRFEDGAVRSRELRVAEPARDAALLLRVLHTHLDGFSAPSPITGLALELLPVRPGASQSHLFDRSLRDANRFASTLSQIEAVLGPGQAGRARLLPSRRQDAFAVDGWFSPAAPAIMHEPCAHGLPLSRFRPPRLVNVLLRDQQPASVQGAEHSLLVLECSGPWLCSGDWWDRAAWQREVWEIAASDGALYQLARENGRWMLDGVFG